MQAQIAGQEVNGRDNCSASRALCEQGAQRLCWCGRAGGVGQTWSTNASDAQGEVAMPDYAL